MTEVRAGLCSVTLRHLDPAEIVDLCTETGLTGIEWAGDVHVPAGDLTTAAEVRQRCADAGLDVPSYGSYACVLTVEGDRPSTSRENQAIDVVLDTALELGAPNVRIWAGSRASARTDAAGRQRVVDQLQAWAELGAAVGVSISAEYHSGTLTDTIDSASRLYDYVDHANLFAYWQAGEYLDPGAQPDVDGELAGLGAILPHLSHLQVFWYRSWLERWPLAEGGRLWTHALALARQPGRWTSPRYALLEFVRDDDPASLREDAVALERWLRESEPE